MKFPPAILSIDSVKEAEAALVSIGCHKKGIAIMKDKALFYAVKLKGLTPVQATSLKQEMLSFSGEAATAFGTINHSVKQTDVLVFGTLAQYKKLARKLKTNYFNLPEIGKGIEEAVRNFGNCPPPLKIKGRKFDFSKRTYIMGILNVTPDSFSDGGKYFSPERAVARGKELIDQGADILDIGGESTRPGARSITVEEELRRIISVVRALAKNKKCVISADTRNAKVAEEALKAGAQIINDVSALRHDKKMAGVIARYKAAVVLMHMQGTPQNMQRNPRYKDLRPEIINYLEKSIAIAKGAGILSDRIIVDPGFGFGKSLEDNYTLLKNLRGLKVLGCAILAGTSRKSMIGKVLCVPAEKRVIGTAATVALAISNGANIIRVHDVFEMKQAALIADMLVRRKK